MHPETQGVAQGPDGQVYGLVTVQSLHDCTVTVPCPWVLVSISQRFYSISMTSAVRTVCTARNLENLSGTLE